MNKNFNAKPKTKQGLYHTGFPIEWVHIDLLEPLTDSSKGKRYILIMTELFTKWLKCASIPDQNAETVTQQFLSYFVVIFWLFLEIHIDLGKQLDCCLF